jgi:hypothetical protein
MPLEDLFKEEAQAPESDSDQKNLCERFGVLANPFPSAAQTSGHPHLSTDADGLVDREVKAFIGEPRSHALAITASQGIGKTNLLNAYEKALRGKLKDRGFFVIRYLADPEPSFEPLVRSIFEHLGEEHLKKVLATASRDDNQPKVEVLLDHVRVPDIKNMLEALIKMSREGNLSNFDQAIHLAHQWLLGLPVRKAHSEQLGINFRLDTVESKTRALREIVFFSAGLDELRGIFLLLDELEKQDFSLSKTVVLRYLSALRALIDALPKYLFLMVALTTDALQRYREMLPALKGRLANEVRLSPIRDEEEALKYWRFYNDEARKAVKDEAKAQGWRCGEEHIVAEADVREVFAKQRKLSSIEGVRQRDFLFELNRRASLVSAS